MKKTNKLLLTLGTAAAITAPVAAVVACGSNNVINPPKDIERPSVTYSKDKTQNQISKHLFNKNLFEKFKKISNDNNSIKYKSKESDILNVANESDINIFFTSAISPFTNLLRLSMISNSENHFFLIKQNRREIFEDRVNSDALQNFYNEKRTNIENKLSTVTNVNGTVSHTMNKALEKIKLLIEQNPSKKINLWGNASNVHFGDLNHNLLDMAGYRNVNLQLLEDGSTNYNYKSAAEQVIKNNIWNNGDMNSGQYLASPIYFDGVVRTWWSSDSMVELNKYGNEKNKLPYNCFKYKTLADDIFNKRDIDGKRLMASWPLISGMNWEKEADIVSDANSGNGLKSLILLGSYGVKGEEDWVKDFWRRYHGKYNIFYKGHPGHNEHSASITEWIKSEQPQNMYILEPMISSEELTRDHVIPKTGKVIGEKYIQFDKIAVVGRTSAVTSEAFPNLDITSDVIEVYDGVNSFKNPSEVPGSKNWGSCKEWLKSI